MPPARLRPLVDERFDLDLAELDGAPRALLSVVPFEDQDFRAAAFPSPRWRFGQTNYRIYVRERASGERAVWFLGTTLGSWTVLLPRYLWRLPWHYGRFSFSCSEETPGVYSRFRIETRSRWAPLLLDLVHEPDRPVELAGFPDRETALVVLTHPLVGHYARRDGRLGSYSVWHDRLEPSPGRLREARFGLLDRLGVVPYAEQLAPHSVLVQPRTEFLIRLPPG